MSRKSMGTVLSLLVIFVAQIIIFNHNSFYGISINLVWIALVIVSPSFDKKWIMPVAVSAGYLSSIIASTSLIIGALNGFALGLVLLYVIRNSYWSLKWVRVIAAIAATLLIDIEHIVLNQVSINSYVLTIVPYYLLVISLFTIFLINLIPESVYE